MSYAASAVHFALSVVCLPWPVGLRGQALNAALSSTQLEVVSFPCTFRGFATPGSLGKSVATRQLTNGIALSVNCQPSVDAYGIEVRVVSTLNARRVSHSRRISFVAASRAATEKRIHADAWAGALDARVRLRRRPTAGPRITTLYVRARHRVPPAARR